jgi:hypothetical protein
MVAVIKFSSSLRNVLNYNENKLKQKKAEFIHSANYGKDTELLGFTDKFKRLQKQMALNENSKKSVVHVSLNFDPSEKLKHKTLKGIADAYMQKIGFGDQPYLVYQHHDAGHPHIHIVSTTIKKDGNRIKTHNIGRNQSEIARKEIEQFFGLVKADSRRQKEAFQLKPVNAQKIQYGRSETKRAITNVLDAVLTDYKYTSFNELNAVLRQYNVIADRGNESSRVFKNNGLVYRVLDERGSKIGVPIKASDLYNNPGLKCLQEKFKNNTQLRQPFKLRIKNAIDLAFVKQSVGSVSELQKALQKEKIQLVIRQNEKGIIYGLTYIDHIKKCVFNGSDLGKQYSANAIQQRCNEEKNQTQKEQVVTHKVKLENDKANQISQQQFSFAKDLHNQPGSLSEIALPVNEKNILTELVQPEYAPDSVPYALRQKKKRRRKRLHL